MRKMIPYCVATAALLALSAQPSGAATMVGGAGLNAALGSGSVTLIADEKNTPDEKKADDANKPTETTKPVDDKKSTDQQKPKKNKAAAKKTSKKEVMGKIKKYVPQEYQGYIQGGAGGAGAAGGAAGAGGAGAAGGQGGGGQGGYGNYGR